MKLAIIRHGEAAMGSNDMKRELTEYGQKQARKVATWLAQQDWDAPSLWASTYVRAQQTADVISAVCHWPIETHADIYPDANPKTVVEQLLLQQQDIILVSHQPLVGYLTSLLLEGCVQPISWQTAECLVLEGNVFAAGCMELSARFSD